MILHYLPTKEFQASGNRLFQFPAELCRNFEDKKALLSHLACGSVNIYLKEVAECLLEGESS